MHSFVVTLAPTVRSACASLKEILMPFKRTPPDYVPAKKKIRGIKELGPKRFRVCVTWTDAKSGRKVKREAIVSSLERAIAKKEELRADQRAKLSREKFRCFVERWIKDRSSVLQPSTRERYIGGLAQLNVEFGDLYVDALEPVDFRKWRDKMKASYAPSTINGWIRIARVALDEAVELGVLAMNPARRTRALSEPRTKGARGVALSPADFGKFIATVEQLAATKGGISADLARMLLVFAWTGCRSGELRAMRWDDWRDDELFVERAVWKRDEKTTKTDDPRTLTVVEPLDLVLKAQRAWLLATQHPGLSSGLMFPASPKHARAGATRRKTDVLSWFRSGSSFVKPLERVIAAAGLPRLSPHALRRTFEKLLRKADVDRMVRKQLAGWSTDDAQAIYSDVDREDRARAGQAVVALVKGAK